MAHILRPYQREAIDALLSYWADGGGNGLIEIPTGGGKSLVIATLCRELLADYPTMRIGVITHVKELVSQNVQELLGVWPGAPVGIYSAGLGRRDLQTRILFMGIQSVHRRAALLGNFDLLLIDEAHLIPRNSDTMYGRFIADCRERVPHLRLVGLTATPYRLDSGRLDEGDEKLFDSLVYVANVRDLIAADYLSPLISKATLAQIDTQGVHRRLGEFVASELEARACIPTVVAAAVQEIVTAGENRAGWLVFCTSVAHAEQVRDEIRRHGVSCETVTGETPAFERDSLVRRYKARQIRCLTSVGVLTTGFNAPHVDLLALLRPTLSTGLYVQMVGRAFRKAEGKENALILDFAGNVVRHGPVDAVNPRGGGGSKDREESEEGDEKVKAKICPACREIVALSTQICGCGFEWPPPPPRHEPRAEEVAILSTEKTAPVLLDVSGAYYTRHSKIAGTDSMLVTYDACGQSIRQWICVEHAGFAGEKARIWWKRMGGALPAPATVEDALSRTDELKYVVAIEVKPNGRFPEIASVRFGEKPTAEERPEWMDEEIPF